MAQHNELGEKGELINRRFSVEKRIRHIIERNYRFDKAKVDIIAQKEYFKTLQ
ncbi:hypothetical protein [Hwangdonia lutea]|uniref:Uncharacterized protein n=1 Tax=Hwangdonia lutea TaxID=3075823 RepID=A0AA97ENG0_9FLAO|nr:hypothetical protein [Hwangdonia sp. SCSIO 19198]WOD44799.1 hypothetical protein RNZ46_05920 [Hwangdonia sp. SCSIO 19198]